MGFAGRFDGGRGHPDRNLAFHNAPPMKVRLTRIFGRSLRAFEAPFEVRLPERGMVQIVAKNADTSGSSGSGKTTLLTTPAAVLGFGPPATKLQSWFDGAVQVEMGVDLAAGDVSLTVERAGKLRLTVNGEKVKGGAAALEERLHRELRMPFDVISTLSHRRQQQGSNFLDMSDDRKKTFMAEPVGVESVEGKLKAGEERIAEAERLVDERRVELAEAKGRADVHGAGPDLADAERRLAEAREAFATAESAVLALLDEQKRQLEQLKSERSAAGKELRATLVACEAEHEAAKKSADEFVSLRAAEAKAAYDDAHVKYLRAGEMVAGLGKTLADMQEADRAERRVLEAQVNAGNLALQRSEVVTKEIRRLRHEISHLSGKVPRCPTCQKDWPEEGAAQLRAAEVELARMTAAEKTLGEQIDAGLWAKSALETRPTPSLSALEAARKAEAILGHMDGQASATLRMTEDGARAEAQAAVTAAYMRLAAAKQAQRAFDGAYPITPLEVEVAESRAARAVARGRVEAIEAELSTLEAARYAATAARRDLAEAQARLDEATKRRDEEADAHEVVKAFVSKIFDEMLLQAADQTNAILADVPNVRGCVLRYKSEVTTKDGRVSRRAIVPCLSIDGHEIGLTASEGASGGMMSVIRMAVDLGVLQAIEGRIGHKLGWLVLDEPFEGLDGPCREACVEILRAQAQDRLILVVDHFSEISGLFDHTITVHHKNGRATIEC